MGGGQGGHVIAKASVQEHGPQGQALRHGGAGPVQPEERNVLGPEGVGRGDALVEQVPGEDVVQLLGGDPGLFQSVVQGFFLHGGLGLFPAFFPKRIVLPDAVKIGGQRPLAFLLAHRVAEAGDGRRRSKADGLLSDFFRVQSILSLGWIALLVCAAPAGIIPGRGLV